MVLYVNGDTQDVHTESEVREAYDEDMANWQRPAAPQIPPHLSSGSTTSAIWAFSLWTLTTPDLRSTKYWSVGAAEVQPRRA